MKNRLILSITILTLMAGPATLAWAERLSLSFKAGPYEILEDPDGFHRIAMEDYEGHPILPLSRKNK